MTADDYRTAIGQLIKRSPKAEKISSYQAAVNFKELAGKAQKVKGKSLEHLRNVFNQLKGFYE